MNRPNAEAARAAHARLYLLNWYYGRRSWETDVYSKVEDILSRMGLPVRCPRDITKTTIAQLETQLRPGDIAVCHQTDVAVRSPFARCYCEPTGITLRSQRLALLERHGLPVMDWIDPHLEDPAGLFEKWMTDTILLKRNNSAQSTGLVVIAEGGSFPQLGPGDVLCRIITDDPHTYKVDFFHDTILGSYVKETPSVLDARFAEWVAGDNRDQRDFPHQNRHFFELPADLASAIRKLGQIMTSMGGGYSGVDLMRTRDGFRIIELNTNNVATKYGWLERPEQYSRNFADGLARLWSDVSEEGQKEQRGSEGESGRKAPPPSRSTR